LISQKFAMKDKKARTLRLRTSHKQGRDTRSLIAIPSDIKGERHDITFHPGQVAVLSTPDTAPGYFAFASAPEDDALEFLIKRTTPTAGRAAASRRGRGVFPARHRRHGFPLDRYHGRDLVMLAMGTGVAPLRSALRHAMSRPEDFGQLFLLYGVRTPADFCYQPEVETWRAAGVELREVISQPDGYEWAGSTGYVQSLLDHVLPELSAPIALVCGSQEMVAQTRDRLHEMGFAEEDVLTNY
jgi:NAD(P)H-flavin reductase